MGSLAIPAGQQDDVAHARAEMFEAFVESLNGAGVTYCLLSGYENFLEQGDSDVDFMVSPRDAGTIAGLLREAARQTGAMLVQALQHETTAWYFVLARQVGGEVTYLHPDCSTDYRRDGRLWLRSKDVLERRRRLGNIFVPSKPDEFLYYLIKKVLKREISEEQLRRLRTLYVWCPEECCALMRQFWPVQSVGAAVSAILSGNLIRMQWDMPSLRAELLASEPVESLPARAAHSASEWRRRATRVMHPAGLTIAISRGSARQREELAAGLERNLRWSFRRTAIVGESEPIAAVRIRTMLVRSTLVIRQMASAPMTRFVRNRICFDLSEAPLDVEHATRAAMEWLAEREKAR
jgi:hypothetical protein